MKKKRIFKEFLISYLIISMIPLTIGIIAYNKALAIFTDETQQNSHNTLKKCMDVIDLELKGLDRTLSQLILDPDIRAMSNGEKPGEDPSMLIKSMDFSKKIKSCFYKTGFLDELIIYFNRSDVLLNSNGLLFLSSNDHYNQFFRYGNMNYEQWYSKILNVNHGNNYMPSETIYMTGFKNVGFGSVGVTTERNMLLCIRAIQMDGDFKGNILAFISQNYIESLLGNIDVKNAGSIYIEDAKGTILMAYPEGRKQLLPTGDLNLLDESNPVTIDGQKMIISTTISSVTGWKYTSVLPFHVVMQKVLIIKDFIIMIFLISIIVGCLGAVYMAYRYSKPLENISRNLHKFFLKDTEQHWNELSFLNSSVLELISDRSQLAENLAHQSELLRTTFLEKLLKGYFNNNDEIAGFARQLGLDELSGKMNVVGVMIISSHEANESEQLDRLNFVKVILKKTFSEKLPGSVYSYDIEFYKSIFIIKLNGTDEEKYRDELENTANEISKAIEKEYGFNLLVASGDIVESAMDISKSYSGAMDAYKQERLYSVSGRKVARYQELIGRKESYYYPIEEETRIVNFAMNGNFETLSDIMESIYDENYRKKNISSKTTRYLINDICCTLIKIAGLLSYEQYESNIMQIEKEIFDINPDSLPADIFSKIIKIYETICVAVNKGKANKTSEMMQSIRQYIDENYTEHQLCRTLVADRFKLSEGYLSRSFKEYIGENISNYIEVVRVKKAIELLMHNENIESVAQMVGYNNVYSFRQSFKRIQGVTPSDYRNKNLLMSQFLS